LTGSAALCSFSAHAQQAGKVPRIGYLGVTSPSHRPSLLDPFRQGLRELGLIAVASPLHCNTFSFDAWSRIKIAADNEST
jgi:hypothetical protein